MTLKMDVVDKVPPAGRRALSPAVVTILERAERLRDGEILKVEGLFPGIEPAEFGGRLSSLRSRGFHIAARRVDGVATAYVWRKDSPAG